MEWIYDPNAWVALLTLTSLEIVLGVDNIIFISVLVGRLPEEQRNKGRNFGLMLAMVSRILLLLSIAWIMKLNTPIIQLFSYALSGRDLILLFGGLFLLAKSTHEIHESIEGSGDGLSNSASNKASFASVILQITIIDIVFSLDSVITAVGLADQV